MIISFTKRASGILFSNITAIILSTGAGVILARVLGPEKRGYFGLVYMAVTLLFTLGHLGTGSAIAYYTGERKRFSRNKILKFTLFSSLALGTIISVIFFFTYGYIKEIWTDIPRSVMIIGLAAVPFFFLFNFLSRFLLAALKVKEANITRVLNSFLYLILIVIVVWMLGGGIRGAVFCFTISFLTACILSFFLFTKEFRPMEKLDFSMTRPIFSYGIRAYMIVIFNFLNFKLDIMLVKYFLTASDVSYYQIAVSIAERFWYLPNAISAILFPTLMAMNKGSAEFSSKICRNNLFLMMILAVVAIFLIRPAVIFLYGEEYEMVTYALFSILWGIVIFPFYRFLASYFASEKKLGYGIFASVTGVIVNVGANILLIPRFGIVGAGVATSISYSVLSIILLIFFRVQTKIKFRDIMVPKGEDFRMYRRNAKKAVNKIKVRFSRNRPPRSG